MLRVSFQLSIRAISIYLHTMFISVLMDPSQVADEHLDDLMDQSYTL